MDLFFQSTMQKCCIYFQLFYFQIHVGCYAQHSPDECHFYYWNKYLIKVYALFTLEPIHHNVGFIFGWTIIFSRFQFVNPTFVSKCLLSRKQLYQLIGVVLMQGIHLILHGTIPLLDVCIRHNFFKAFQLPFISQ